ASIDVQLRGIEAHNNATDGLHIVPSGSGTVTVVASDSVFNGNGNFGVLIDGQSSTGAILATLNVAAAHNAEGGVVLGSPSGKAQVVVMITGSKIINNYDKTSGGGPTCCPNSNGVGLEVTGNVRAFVDTTRITGNVGNGWGAFLGAV